MRISRSLLFGLIFIFVSAHAHMDRILSLLPDGSIPELPSALGTVSLKISGLGSNAPAVEFDVGSNRDILPTCVTSFIRSKQLDDVRVTGSWYHDESDLPYYVNVQFYEPSPFPHPEFDRSLNILFNLHTAEVIWIKRRTPTDTGFEELPLKLAAGCTIRSKPH